SRNVTKLGLPRRLVPVYSRTRVVMPDQKVMIRHHIVANQISNPALELYRSLRAQVLQRLSRAKSLSFAVTSLAPRERKTVTAINLALAMSMDMNRTVLLVDANLRRPAIHRFFGIEPAHSIDEILQGTAQIEDCLINPQVERLVLLPARDVVANSA